VVALLAVVVVLALVPASAIAGQPAVIGFPPHATGAETEVVSGEINPGGEATEYVVQYGPSSSPWCGGRPSFEALLSSPEAGATALTGPLLGARDGDWAKAPHSTHPTKLPFSDEEHHPVLVEVGGLTPGTEYCAQLVADNHSGSASGGKVLFTAGAPGVSGSTFAPAVNELEAEVDPAGQASQYQVLYAQVASEWCLSLGSRGTATKLGDPVALPYTDGAFHLVRVELTGLVAGTEYCAALYAENSSGNALGLLVSFSELPTIESVTPAAGPASGGSTVTIRGENLDDASVHFGSSTASILTDTSEQIVVASPAHEAGSVDVTVTTPAGTSAVNAGDRYTYEATPTPPSGGGGSTTPSTTPGGGTGTEPGSSGETLGETEVVGALGGTVTVRQPGSTSFAPFSGSGPLRDGSEIDATHGRVLVTVRTPEGTLVSAEVFGGRFRIHQDKNGETHFILTLPLTGCARTKLPRGAAAAVLAKKRRKRARSRYLWVTEKGGRWGTNGRYVSTSVEGTTWLTLDECGRSVVQVAAGRVRVRDLVTRKTRTLTAGGRYVAYAHPNKHRPRKKG
jgi:hypothetical protein